MTARDIAAGAIQRTYGDATQTVLDHRAASAVVGDLRNAGWMSPQEVAAIVLAAGGSVTISDAQLRMLDELELSVADDYAAGLGSKKVMARVRPAARLRHDNIDGVQ